MEEITYERLRRIQQKERASGMLVELPKSFYSSASSHIQDLRKQIRQEFKMEKAKEYENTVKILRDIIGIRTQKILLRAMRAASSDETPGGITPEERDFFERVKTDVKNNQTVFEKLINPPESPSVATCEIPVPKSVITPEASESEKVETGPSIASGLRVKFVKEIPQFVGADMNKYGPFKQGEVACLPSDVADLLFKRSIAERFE